MSDSVIQSKAPKLSQAQRQQALAQQRDVFDGCLAVYEAFRRFGFKPEEIFFDNRVRGTPGQAGVGTMQSCVGMTLRSQGKEFVTNCGHRCDPGFLSDDELLEIWNHHSGRWNTGMTTDARMRIWHTKMPPELLLSLALNLKRAGFIFPNPAFEKNFAGDTVH